MIMPNNDWRWLTTIPIMVWWISGRIINKKRKGDEKQ